MSPSGVLRVLLWFHTPWVILWLILIFHFNCFTSLSYWYLPLPRPFLSTRSGFCSLRLPTTRLSVSLGLLAGYNCHFSWHFLSLYLSCCVPCLFCFKLWSHNNVPCLLVCSIAQIHSSFFLYCICSLPLYCFLSLTGFYLLLCWQYLLQAFYSLLYFPLSHLCHQCYLNRHIFNSLRCFPPFRQSWLFKSSKAMSPHLPACRQQRLLLPFLLLLLLGFSLILWPPINGRKSTAVLLTGFHFLPFPLFP